MDLLNHLTESSSVLWPLASTALLALALTIASWALYAIVHDLRRGRRAVQRCFVTRTQESDEACAQALGVALFPTSAVILHAMTICFWTSIAVFLIMRSKSIANLLMTTRQLRKCIVEFEQDRLIEKPGK